MDAYLAKPFHPGELFETLESLLLLPVPHQSSPDAAVSDGSAFDRSALLARLDSDQKVLNEIIALFEEDCPKLIGDVHKAVQDRNAKALAESAHTLKGMLGIMCASRAQEASRKLERLGRLGDFTNIELALRELDTEVEALLSMLITPAGESIAL
jgi:HPt (histidine-containing phosphotransfer) domain-containing protein